MYLKSIGIRRKARSLAEQQDRIVRERLLFGKRSISRIPFSTKREKSQSSRGRKWRLHFTLSSKRRECTATRVILTPSWIFASSWACMEARQIPITTKKEAHAIILAASTTF